MIHLEFETHADAAADGWGPPYRRVRYKGDLFTGTIRFSQREIWPFQSFLKGELHSFDDLPASDNGSTRCWFKNGQRHRETGPAISHRGGNDFFYLDNQSLFFDDWLNCLNVSSAEKVLLKMQYG